MRKYLLACSIALLVSGLQSCSSSSGPSGSSYTPQTVSFRQGATATYDFMLVDIDDPANGHHADSVLTDSAQHNVIETVLDTSAKYGGYSHVTLSYFAAAPPDSNYYYQDADGNLWRYNYGFSRLNQYSFLLTYVGSPIDVGWVLVAKPGSPAGTTWVAKSDSVALQSAGGAKIYLKDQATTMNDTTFTIGGSAVAAEHVRHLVHATDVTGALTGDIVIDTYLSPSLGATIEDFFHHSTITNPFTQSKIQQKGSLKIMTVK